MKKQNTRLCVICKLPVSEKDWLEICEKHIELLDQVDLYGEKSLTEKQQLLYHNLCHAKCYIKLLEL